jgi:hypothetical protein
VDYDWSLQLKLTGGDEAYFKSSLTLLFLRRELNASSIENYHFPPLKKGDSGGFEFRVI